MTFGLGSNFAWLLYPSLQTNAKTVPSTNRVATGSPARPSPHARQRCYMRSPRAAWLALRLLLCTLAPLVAARADAS